MPDSEETYEAGTFVQYNKHGKDVTAEVIGPYKSAPLMKCGHSACIKNKNQKVAVEIKYLQTGKLGNVWCCKLKPI